MIFWSRPRIKYIQNDFEKQDRINQRDTGCDSLRPRGPAEKDIKNEPSDGKDEYDQGPEKLRHQIQRRVPATQDRPDIQDEKKKLAESHHTTPPCL